MALPGRRAGVRAGRPVVDRGAGPRRGPRRVSGPAFLCVTAAGAAAALLLPGRARWEPPTAGPARLRARGDWLGGWRPLWVVLAAVGAAVFVGGVGGLVAAPVAGVVPWLVVERAEPAPVRRERERARH